MQVFQAGKLSNLFHAARKACHVKNQTVIEQGIVILVLNIDGDAVARDIFAAIVSQQQIGFNTTVTHFARNIGVYELRVLDAVRTDKVQRGI